MARPHAAFALALTVVTALTATTRSAAAQSLPFDRQPLDLALPHGQTSGVDGSTWTRALAVGGRLPNHERMLVVSAEGLVLNVVDGDRQRVALPLPLLAELSRDPLRVTLVHNHPDSVSLSGPDLIQLAKVGVERVVAVGHDGSVYEASAAAAYGLGTTIAERYDELLGRVLDRLAADSRLDNNGQAALYPQASHIVALVLDRAGIIRYSAHLSVDTWLVLAHHRELVGRIVDVEAARLVQARRQVAAR